jgi:hypothetical protein
MDALVAWKAVRRWTAWRRRAKLARRPEFDALEGRIVPATSIAPYLLPASDTGLSNTDHVTRDALPRVAGVTTSPAGATIQLLVDNVPQASYTVPLSGGSVFTLQPATPLADGTHTLRFSDSSTKTNSAALTVRIDTAPATTPSMPTLDPTSDTGVVGDGVTKNTMVDFQVQGNAGDLLTLHVGPLQATATATGSPQDIAVDVGSLPDSTPVDVWAQAEDAAGNLSAASPTSTFMLDETAPSSSTDLHLDPNSDTGVSASDNITAATSLLFAGTGEAGDTVTLLIDGNSVSSATVANDGSYNVTASDVADGTHDATVTLTDPAGNVSDPSSVVSFTVDTTPPIVDAGGDQEIPEGSPITLTGQASDPNLASEQWQLVSSTTGQSVDPAEGTTINFTPVSAGQYVFRHLATDLAGNVGSADVTVTVDDVPPTIDVTGPTTATATEALTISFQASDPGNEPIDGWHIAWGDGTTDELSGDATQATHTYTQVGSFTPQVAAIQGSLITTATLHAPIDVAPPPPPSLTQTSVELPAILENATDVGSVNVADLVTDLGVVVGADRSYGLAIVAVDDSIGTWQSSADGTNWSPLDPGSTTFLPATAQLRFLPTAGQSGVTSLTVHAWDPVYDLASLDSAAVSLSVAHVNAPPTLSMPISASIYRGQPVSIASMSPGIAVADTDDSRLHVDLSVNHGSLLFPSSDAALVAIAGGGTSQVGLEGTITALDTVLADLMYEPAGDYLGLVKLSATVTDFAESGGTPASITGHTDITIVDRAPTIVGPRSYAMNANSVLTVVAPGLRTAFTDADGDTLQIQLAAAPKVGTLKLNADGSFTYTPPRNFVGKVQFSVRAFDGAESSAPLVVTIDVKSIFGLRR